MLAEASDEYLVIEFVSEVDVMPSGPEWFIVLAVVLLIFGGSQLPKLARNLGQAQREFKDGLAETQRDAGSTSP